jgi:ubiquinone/menaquinone biosynthesis C-methylase UbiE
MNEKQVFDFDAVKDFDNHINLSIPDYDSLIRVFTALYLESMPPEGKCIDIGCSTGKLLNTIPRIRDGNYHGCDVVKMCEDSHYQFEFQQKDCVEFLKSFTSVDVIFSIFTLQFLGKHKRKDALVEVKRLIDEGAVFLVAEKVYCDNAKVNTILHREHMREKREHFSDEEILDKDYQLFGTMFCSESTQIDIELGKLGKYEQVWQSYNFKGWIVQKGQS